MDSIFTLTLYIHVIQLPQYLLLVKWYFLLTYIVDYDMWFVFADFILHEIIQAWRKQIMIKGLSEVQVYKSFLG